ncbi:FAD-dependent oxidoreductase [Candidatus Fermentibacteria bacterium]|nr:FAD-dependent oxidoreductase [Candidatus Fermentibacteria bacterium]
MPEPVKHPSPSAIIVGAGIAGLCLADRLSASGVHVIVLEREEKVGGLARSLIWGDYVFDIGPKRFHTYSAQVEGYLHEVLGKAYRTIGRKSSVYFLGRLFPWPLQTSSVFKLPPVILARCMMDMFRKPQFDGKSFSSYILSRYGKTLYEVFFRDYTRKFCHVDPEGLHEAWAQGSIHRAIIDKRYDQGSLLDVARVALLPKRTVTRFLYPVGGMDRFHDAVVRRIRRQGGQIHVNTPASLSLQPNGSLLVETPNAAHGADRVFWTAPVTEAYQALLGRPAPLRHLTLALFAIEARHVRDDGNQWTYFSSPDILVSRTSYPRSFDPGLVPRDRASIVAEVTVPERRTVPWDAWEERVLRDLNAAGVCRPADVTAVHRALIPHAYPLYELPYQDALKHVLDELAAFPGLTLAGRCGKFCYNNMDDSIEDSMTIAQEALAAWNHTSPG